MNKMEYDFARAREEYPKLSKDELIEKLIVAEATNVAHCVTIFDMQEFELVEIAKIKERMQNMKNWEYKSNGYAELNWVLNLLEGKE